MLVHRCDRCCVHKKEIQPCRTKYSLDAQNDVFRLKVAILFQTVHSANSVRFLLSRKFSPRVPPEPLCVPQFGNRGARGTCTSLMQKLSDQKVIDLNETFNADSL